MPASPSSPPAKPQAKSPAKSASPQSSPVRWHWSSALAGALISAILLGGITFLWRIPTPSPIAIHAPPSSVAPTPEPTEAPAPLVIFISGAVQTPGVYELPASARVADALERAGGFTPDANVNALNQAATLRDGDQIYVPTFAEEPAAPQPGLSSTEPAANSEGGPININTATASQLEQLPGIGPSRAQDIIENRPYASVDELDNVPGIGPATLEELRPYVVVE
jgi:competence protein ComEA